jgi:acyl-coenzyme A thioesterase PaaI-like protein
LDVVPIDRKGTSQPVPNDSHVEHNDSSDNRREWWSPGLIRPSERTMRTLPAMQIEEARIDAAAALRNLNHAFVAHDPDVAQLQQIARDARTIVAQLETVKRRDRLALMRAGVGTDSFPSSASSAGFADRAVAGAANPTSIDIEAQFEPEEVVARVVLRRAFEGAPGRAHGGMVAAAFDDVTGFVIGQLREPAFTGELTVRYVAPVPVEEPLEMRARLESRERRKLFITAEARHNGEVVATCRAIYITVDRTQFAGFPDPR